MRKRKKDKIIDFIVILVMVWLFASFCNVINHNMTDHHFAFWNAFQLLAKVCQEVK